MAPAATTLGSSLSGASVGIALVAIFGTLAIVGHETKRIWLMAFMKPLATACLLLVVGPPPTGDVEKLIAFGIVFSIVGDALLVGQSDRAFFGGTAAFLTAQLLYAAAFWSLRSHEHPVSPVSLVVVIVSALLVALLWRPAGALRPAVVVYTVAITLMVGAAIGTIGGPLSPVAAGLVAIGAILFYVSDASLAWNKFRRPLRHASFLTMGVYWIGQIGIALAIRISAG